MNDVALAQQQTDGTRGSIKNTSWKTVWQARQGESEDGGPLLDFAAATADLGLLLDKEWARPVMALATLEKECFTSQQTELRYLMQRPARCRKPINVRVSTSPN